MCECASRDPAPANAGPIYAFGTPTGYAVAAHFDAGRMTSDGGLPWLSEADRALGLCATLAACIPEWRRGPVRRTLETLVRERVFQIACGYAEQNDAAPLRADPLRKLMCGRLPLSGTDLASQPTLSRLEHAGDRRTIEALAEALVTVYVRERGQAGPPRRVRLDLDGTAAPAHGQQERVAYHGYYRQRYSPARRDPSRPRPERAVARAAPRRCRLRPGTDPGGGARAPAGGRRGAYPSGSSMAGPGADGLRYRAVRRRRGRASGEVPTRSRQRPLDRDAHRPGADHDPRGVCRRGLRCLSGAAAMDADPDHSPQPAAPAARRA
jgi:hypothetical protein